MKKIKVESCKFIPLSQVGISMQGRIDILDSNHVTFGDANKTLFRIDRLRTLVDWTRPKDEKRLTTISDKYGPEIFIDLEN